MQNKWKHIEISCNLQTTISFDWNEIFSICKKLKSSDFYGGCSWKTFKHIFHTFGVSSKPKRKKIRKFWPKILLWIVIFLNRGLLWLYGVWQNKAQRVPEHLQRVSLLDKFFIIICVKGRCVSRILRLETWNFVCSLVLLTHVGKKYENDPREKLHFRTL